MIKRLWDITLTAKDLKTAVDFYENILGLDKKYEFKDYAGFDCGGVEIGIKTWGKMEPSRRGEPVVDFLVDDVDAAYADWKAKGVKFVKQPEDAVWGGRFAVFLDPDGNTLQIVQVNWRRYLEVCSPKS
jgi:catechol 2,3-dioxygenase-like lactoylglutathione lyase family enzyme